MNCKNCNGQKRILRKPDPLSSTEISSLVKRGLVKLPKSKAQQREGWRIAQARYRKNHTDAHRKYQREYMRALRANRKRLLGADLYEI